jgi:hypothetical protein
MASRSYAIAARISATAEREVGSPEGKGSCVPGLPRLRSFSSLKAAVETKIDHAQRDPEARRWVFERFDLSLTEAGAFFFWLACCRHLRFLSRHGCRGGVGLSNTMVCTHIPSSIALMLAAFAPTCLCF